MGIAALQPSYGLICRECSPLKRGISGAPREYASPTALSLDRRRLSEAQSIISMSRAQHISLLRAKRTNHTLRGALFGEYIDKPTTRVSVAGGWPGEIAVAFIVHQVSVDVHNNTARVVLRDPPTSSDGASVTVDFGFTQVGNEGGQSVRVVQEALQVLKQALD